MKVRHLKLRAKLPEFRITPFNGTKLIEIKSAAAAMRFFGTTKEEDQRAAEFFGYAGTPEPITAEVNAEITRPIS